MIGSRWRLAAELRRWRRAGQRANLWWRDDDARGPSPALERLLALSDRRRTPLTLAVIPDPRLAELAPSLELRPWVVAVQHGVDHRNRRQDACAGEMSPHWTRQEIEAAVTASWARMAALPGARRVFVPPWNDVHPALPEALRRSRYDGLSAWGEVRPAGRSFRVDAHVDLMRWREGPRFRGAARFRRVLTEALRRRRLEGLWDAPIGVLTHHLDHDPAAWAFLDAFLAWSGERPELAWVSLGDVLAGRMELAPTGA